MVTSIQKKWQIKESDSNIDIEQLAAELNVSKLLIEICIRRGLTTPEEITNFIHVDETWFHDPFLLYDMEKSVERITEALEANEQITIYGDYDADGMTSTAVLTETLESLGANVNYYLPNRFVEGYGPNTQAFEQIIQNGTSLIITVDNGVAGHEAISRAKELGVDVIVTDHHELPENLPDAYTIIHPNHPEGSYPFKDLAGVGVTFKLAHALIGELPVETLDLAAIGTVADLVPLKDENRAIVFFGLKMIEHTQRIGLLQLLNVIGKKPDEVTEETIGFQIAPRLNAVGRLGEAGPCVELLSTHDPDRARELAEYVNSQNEERKMIVETMTEEVKEQLRHSEKEQEVIVLADENWHQGVLGIVASRVVEHTNKPTLLFTIDKETNIAKGSARSIEGFNIYDAFQNIGDLFTQFGGHSMAAGMSAELQNLQDIQLKLSDMYRESEKLSPIQWIDAVVPLSDITIETIKEIENLRPFGTGNDKPVVASETVTVLQKRGVGVDNSHLKLLIGQEGVQLDIISFQNGHIADVLFEQQEIAVAGYLEINEWNGSSKPQLQMIDINIPGPVLIDQRTNQLTPGHFQLEQTSFVFYNQSTYEEAAAYIPESSNAVLINNVEEAKEFVSSKNIVIVDCPNSIDLFKGTVSNNENTLTTCYFYKKEHLFLNGLPVREDFVRAYKFFATHKNVDLKNQGNILARKLKLDSSKIFLIVRVFLEANFVIINDGVLNIVKHPEKIDILSTKAYKEAQDQMRAEELYIYSSFKEVISATI